MSKSRTALTAGYMPLDIIQTPRAVWQRAGGTAANVAAILALLGWDASVAGRAGDDRAGHALLADLASAGVDTALIDVEDGALTNRIVHQVRARGHRYLYRCPHCTQALPRSRPLRPSQLDAILQARPAPDVFFFDRANPVTVRLAEHYAAVEATVVFEPSTPAAADLIQRALHAATIVKGSHERGSALVENAPPGRTDQLQIITEGADGARVRRAGGPWRRVGVFETNVVDAAGSGDWTTAGMLHRVSASRHHTIDDIADAIQYGHALAALNCRLPGARGLAEGHTAASIRAMVANLRRGNNVDVRSNPAAADDTTHPSSAQVDFCAWCLLNIEHERPRQHAIA